MSKNTNINKNTIKLKYGHTKLEMILPPNYKLIQTTEDGREDLDWQQKIKSAFTNPLDSPTLTEIVNKEKPGKIVIIINDITRPVPYEIVLKPMLAELELAGVSETEITLLIATGMHRAMTEEEVQEMLGEEIVNKYRWVNHNCEEEMVYAGEVNDIPLYVNPLIMEADLLCAVGVIAPHYMAGYSGGRKSVLPGVCGRKTIEAHHSLMRLPHSRTANLKGNKFHETMVQAAGMVNLRFISNVVVDSKNQVVDLVTGDYLKAWERGVEICQQNSVIELAEPADVVIVSAGGFPKDINLYQAQKALENASYCVKDGGSILLIAECAEGLGEDTFERWLIETSRPEDLEKRIKENFELGGHKAYAIGRVARDHKLYMYSQLEDEVVYQAFMSPVKSLSDFIKENITANDLVYVIPHGANTVPVCTI